MDPFASPRWAEIDILFARALDRPPDERTAFLRAACGSDPALYRAVVALLASDAEAEAALGERATDFAAHLLDAVGLDAVDAPDLAPGTRVGAYRVEGELGRGGMGVVYRAARADGAFEKAVALKLVKRGTDTDEVLRRFRYERRVLAGLDHPNIARLLDAGAHRDGRPYVVMELAEGAPITAYADARRLGVEARLALFAQAAEAVAYAHRHLVVHRDLKPSNILVTPDGQVKLLDFGIAKLLAPDAPGGPGAHGSALTRPERRVLTPEYAAPEQARGGALTTATDVYALGVVLAELLAGARPSSPAARPSAAVTLAAAAARATTPERLRRRLRGDLDTVCQMALRAEPERRYPSATALLDDLDRHRRGLPVVARPATAAYRAGRFVRRHRLGVAAAAAFVALLAAFGVAMALQQRATARERDAAEQVAAFLEDVFTASDPFAAAPERLDSLRARDLLARGAARVRRDLADQPELQARLLTVVGGVLGQLSLPGEARPLLEEALATRRARLGPDHEAVAETQAALATVARHEGRYAEAEAHLTGALATFRRVGASDAPRTLAAQRALAKLYQETGRYAEAEGLLRDLAARYRAAPRDLVPDADLDRASALALLALVLRLQERYAEAEAPAREALALRRAALGDGHPHTADALSVLGSVLRNQGDLDAAEAAYREALALQRRVLGDGHRDTEIGKTHLAELLRDRGRFDEAAALYRAVLARAKRDVGDDHPGVAIITGLLANVLLDAGAYAEAEAAYRDALARMARALPPGHARAAHARVALGRCLMAQRRFTEAEAELLAVHTAPADASGTPPGGDRAAQALADLYDAWGRPTEAARYRAVSVGT